MATEVLKSFGTLQSELEQAKTSLKDVDENIKRLIGRDPSESQARPGAKRLVNHGDESKGRARGLNNTQFGNTNFTNNRNKPNYESEEQPAIKKRNLDSSVFKRLSDRSRHYDEDVQETPGKQLISKVIMTPKEIPSRQEVLAAQGADEKSKARNRRMFGALLGTLQKFRQEETKLKPKEEKRAQVEKKLEEQQIREREELKKERQDLFLNRKRKQAEIRMIELKMTRMKELTEWEEKQRPLMNFIQTKSRPHMYYLPKVLNEQNKKLLEACRQHMEKTIDRKRQDVFEELSVIEQKMKRNFSRQQGTNDSEKLEVDVAENEDNDIEDGEENDDEHRIEKPELQEATPVEELDETKNITEETTETKSVSELETSNNNSAELKMDTTEENITNESKGESEC